MNRPIHFEIPAEKPERAIEFYEKVFGWKFEKWDGPAEYWIIRTGESTPETGGFRRGGACVARGARAARWFR